MPLAGTCRSSEHVGPPGIRALCGQLLREDELCKSVEYCADSIEIRDESGDRLDVLPCAECPKERLEEEMRGPAGQLLRAAFDLEFDLDTGLALSLDEIGAAEYAALRVIKQERAQRQEELDDAENERRTRSRH